ncbi:protein YIPF6-like protein [Hibiscus syriacus]|uniref:Protein YIPF6-like protein n=1 Tax=Hibiscus syriacus TaxID=106335 RepID=A0A6A3BKH2_HIBSY|nr:uncharacterized protein LOC120213738 [Hibiscus syriacus]KAE8717510.1 protein YIPF6-like protein [Hibiscus syriacus]
MELLGRLRRVVKKIKLLLSFDTNRWRVASMIGGVSRKLSFTDRPGLSACVDADDDSDWDDSCRCSNRLARTTSYQSEDDVDKRAEMFIANFHRQLRMERQVSLQLKYLGGNSFGYYSP